MHRYGLFILIMISFFITACSRAPASAAAPLIVVQKNAFAKTLFYAGKVQPLNSVVIASPADGTVIDMPFQYGEKVKAGDLLFSLSSSKFLSDYKTSLMQYVKAKSDFNTSETALKEGEFLHKNQLISDDDYKSKQSNFYANRLALLQAKDALQSLLQQLDIKNVNLYDLSISDIDRLTAAMHLQMSSDKLHVLAPNAGIVLAATKNEDETKKVLKGDSIKQGDALAMIGDMTGMSIHIKVNELTIDQLHVGQKVKVTGIAFPQYQLMGSIKKVDRQGEAGSNGGLPLFSVELVVPTLTAKEQNDIQVGMSANVEIVTDETSQIMIPMTALFEKDGTSYVKRYNTNTKILDDVPVQTGETTLDSVAIISGLNPGDHIASTH